MGIFSALFGAPEPKQDAVKMPLISSINRASLPFSDYTIIDTETGGLEPTKCDLLEIGAIQYRSHEEVKRYKSYVRPTGKIPPNATQSNHISWSTVSRAPGIDHVKTEFLQFIGDDILVGYNLDFDLKFLQTRMRCRIPNLSFDVLPLARKAFPHRDHYRLTDMRSYLGIDLPAHNAIDDCAATAIVFRAALQTPGAQSFSLPRSTPSNPDDDYPEAAYVLWMHGEEERLNGNIETALEFFDSALGAGFTAPVIYQSYAMAFRKRRDYEKEISILDEAISRFSGPVADSFLTRKKRAEELMLTARKREAAIAQKVQERAEKAEARRKRREMEESKPKKSSKRALLQCADDGTVIKEFASISAAAEELGISSSCIRDAARGKQKHAGGFCWKYITPDIANDESSDMQKEVRP